ncbi:wax ester/triacylglycerol synthase family O-acyltransferase [Zhongshania guokunii]|uniref:diacylglycerol O-acyltransferase n=1 Tax=Zhongshania guokunii TaxID=641783 RepID=A0ABV3U0R1_9GAMM
MKQLKPQDAQFLYMETENNLSNATMVCVYTPPQSLEQSQANYDPLAAITKQLQNRLHLSTIFTHRIKSVAMNLDYPYWAKDPHFKLENHLSETRAAAPGDRAALNKAAADFHSRPLDLRRPPWEIHLISGLDSIEGFEKGSFALLIKIHHAAIDGTSAMQLFLGLHDDSPDTDEAAPSTNTSEQAHPYPQRQQLLRNAGSNYLSSPRNAANRVFSQLKSRRASKSQTENLPPVKKPPVPKTRFNQAVSPGKKLATHLLSLEQLKSLRQLAPGATLNDVILGLCSGTLHRYLNHHGELPNTPLVAWVPINARLPGGASDDGNNISAMAIDLASQITDPIERLQLIVATTQDAKAARTGLAARMVTDLSQQLPSLGMAAFTKLLLASGVTGKICNLAISNVPGPAKPFYLRGAQCREQYGMVPLGDHMGLFFVVMSYNGALSVTITTTEDILPDDDFLVSCLQEEFSLLCQLLK